jgi:hypothetical protein
MKRKLKINRETLRNLIDQETRGAAGGATNLTCPCVSIFGSCFPQCTVAYSACVLCR